MTAASHGPYSSHPYNGPQSNLAATGGMPPSASFPSSPRDLMNVPHLQGQFRSAPTGYGSIPLPSERPGHHQASTSAIAPNPSSSSTAIVPYTPPDSPVTPIAAPTPAAPAPASKSKFNLNDIKGALDRMGGIDGLISQMGKVQKVMQSVQEIVPVAKMLVGSFGSGKKKKRDEDDELFYDPRPKRKRRPSGKRPRKKRTSSSTKSRPKAHSPKPLRPRR